MRQWRVFSNWLEQSTEKDGERKHCKEIETTHDCAIQTLLTNTGNYTVTGKETERIFSTSQNNTQV